jgi:hypothetical protein
MLPLQTGPYTQLLTLSACHSSGLTPGTTDKRGGCHSVLLCVVVWSRVLHKYCNEVLIFLAKYSPFTLSMHYPGLEYGTLYEIAVVLNLHVSEHMM